jgi:hypothetical protein
MRAMRTQVGFRSVGERLGRPALCAAILLLAGCETPPSSAGASDFRVEPNVTRRKPKAPTALREPGEPAPARGYDDSDERFGEIPESHTLPADMPQPVGDGPPPPDSDAVALAGGSTEPRANHTPSPTPARQEAAASSVDSDEAAIATPPPIAAPRAAAPPPWTGRRR